MSSGRLIAVVGPSGVGKDSLMAALAAKRPDIHIVRRVITRDAALGGEDFEAVGEEEFRQREAAGEFCLSWPAHGLLYGIPTSIEATLDQGQDALVNLSRGVLAQAAVRFATFTVLRITARSDILAQRLAVRGRESAEDIRRRLERPEPALPEGVSVITVENNTTIEDAVAQAMGALYPERV